MLSLFRRRRQEEINALSATAAMGWTSLFNGLGGKDSAQSKPQDFLPFNPSALNKKQARISGSTRSIIKHLVDRNKLPPILTNVFMQLLED
jgi:hypothetical protein